LIELVAFCWATRALYGAQPLDHTPTLVDASCER